MRREIFWKNVGFTLLALASLVYLALTGCQSTQIKDNLQLVKGITDAAKSGNVAGTLKVHIVGSVEAYQHLNFGIGNPQTIIDADLQFKFSKDK